MSMTVSVRTTHKGPGKAVGQKRHDLREGYVPKYVDRSRSGLNSVLIKPLGEADLKQICLERRSLKNTKRAMKKDASLSTTGIITWGKEAQGVIEALSVEDQDKLYSEIARRLSELLSSEITGLVVHRDESAPHAHYQMPAYATDGRPLSKVMTPAIAVKMQDVAGEVLASLGLGEIKRGVPKATRIAAGEPTSAWVHRSVKQLHDDLPQEIAELEKVIDSHKEKIRVLSEEFLGLVEKRAKELTMDLKAQADRMRALPLHEVLTRVYGAELVDGSKENHSARKYQVGDAKIGVSPGRMNDEVWIDNHGTGKGKGAIDLVMYLSQVDYKRAVRLLIDQFDDRSISAELTHHSASYAVEKISIVKKDPPPLPVVSSEKWPKVRQYLTEVRALPEKIVDALHDEGKVYADSRGNCVFLRAKAGAFIRGTVEEQPWKQTIGGKSCGPFVIEGHDRETVFVESPIDAISLKVLRPETGRIIALGGNLLSPDDVADYVRSKNVLAGFDRDIAGETLAHKVYLKWLMADRLMPVGHDWNEDLKDKAKMSGQILAGDESEVPLDGLFSAKPARDPGAWPEPASDPSGSEELSHDDGGFKGPGG